MDVKKLQVGDLVMGFEGYAVMDFASPRPVHLITFREYFALRFVECRREDPALTQADFRRLMRAQVEQEWLMAVFNCPRETVLPLAVGRSLVSLVGHVDASRMVRHVANFPACLPRRAVVVSPDDSGRRMGR